MYVSYSLCVIPYFSARKAVFSLAISTSVGRRYGIEQQRCSAAPSGARVEAVGSG